MHTVPIKSDVTTAISVDQEVTSNEFLLLRELSHRIKNEFASAIGYISTIASRSTSEDAKLALAGVADLCTATPAYIGRFKCQHTVLRLMLPATFARSANRSRAPDWITEISISCWTTFRFGFDPGNAGSWEW